MVGPKLALVAVAFSLAAVASGCGGSSNSSNSSTPPTPSSPLQVTTNAQLPTGVVNAPYTTTLTATGGITPYAWNVASGNLPAGLSLNITGVISGTPTTTGNSSFTVAVSDSEQPPRVANGPFTITINPALQITTTSLPSGSANVSYGATLAAAGGLAPYSWSLVNGNLPVGLTLNATSGVISGIPNGPGTSSFTVQVSDSETPAATATANLSIVINPPPARSAALYTSDCGVFLKQTGLQIQSDGSLTLLPSSPESAITGAYFASSPTLPLLFTFLKYSGNGNPYQNYLQSLLVNPDYSLDSISSTGPFPGQYYDYGFPSVDPTGSNLYLPGFVNGSAGITAFPANGSLQPLSTIGLPDVTGFSARLVFTPDGTQAFLPICTQSGQGEILSFSRGSNGMLTSTATYNGPGCTVAGAMSVSPDGRYLATNEIQIYSIASDGTLTPILPQPVTLTYQGNTLSVSDLAWDSSGSFLLAAAEGTGVSFSYGGVAVLTFDGSTLIVTVPPTGGAVVRLQSAGSFEYALQSSPLILGYDFQNGQLTPLPGSPYLYGNGCDMVIY